MRQRINKETKLASHKELIESEIFKSLLRLDNFAQFFVEKQKEIAKSCLFHCEGHTFLSTWHLNFIYKII